MTSGQADRDGHSEPTVAVLAPHWESRTEEGWMTRQVGGALACNADVHVITPDGVVPGTVADGVFTVHRLATPLEQTAELHRDLLVKGLVESGSATASDALGQLIDRDLIGPWGAATAELALLRPDLVVIAGHQHVGALLALDRFAPSVPTTLLALGSDLDSLSFPHFDRLFERAQSVLVVTGEEHDRIATRHGMATAIHRIGAPMAASQSVLTEPDLAVGSNRYALVVTDVDADADHWENRVVDILRMRLPDALIAVSQNDYLGVWHRGRLDKGPPVERSSDLARLMAWARTTVDLRPGRLFARRCVESLLYGTPIVVPADSRAREHAERGRGGLWFANPPELTWCVEAMFDPETRASLGTQGQAYAEREFASTDEFIDRVTVACGLRADSATTPTGDTESLVG